MCTSLCFVFLYKRNTKASKFWKVVFLSERVGVVAAVSLSAHDIIDVTRCIRPSINERCITRCTLAKLKYRG